MTQAFTLVGSGRVGTALAKLGGGSDVWSLIPCAMLRAYLVARKPCGPRRHRLGYPVLLY